MTLVKQLLAGMALIGLCACATPPTATEEVLPSPPHELDFMFGEWVGEASGIGPDRQPYQLIQTERVGPMLGGDVVVIEGAGYASDGEMMFNAFAIVSRGSGQDGWEIRSYAQGRSGTFPFQPTETGYIWSTPAGPNAEMRYTATFEGDTWNQVGEYVSADRPPVQTFQMTLTRRDETSWPAAGAVDPALETD